MMFEEIDMSDNQKRKMIRALKAVRPVNIRIPFSNMSGNIPIIVTSPQQKRMDVARSNGKGMLMKFSTIQMREMNKKHGGILPLAGLLFTGLVVGISTGIGKIIGKKVGRKAFGKGISIQSGRNVNLGNRTSTRKNIGGPGSRPNKLSIDAQIRLNSDFRNVPRRALRRNLPPNSNLLTDNNPFMPDPRNSEFNQAIATTRRFDMRNPTRMTTPMGGPIRTGNPGVRTIRGRGILKGISQETSVRFPRGPPINFAPKGPIIKPRSRGKGITIRGKGAHLRGRGFALGRRSTSTGGTIASDFIDEKIIKPLIRRTKGRGFALGRGKRIARGGRIARRATQIQGNGFVEDFIANLPTRQKKR